MKNPALKFLTPAIACLCLGLGSSKAANLSFETTPITTGGTYSWDGTTWGSATGGSSWVAGDFAEFDAAKTYTVTVANDELMAGLYNETSGGNITFNAIGSGDIDIASGVQGFIVAGTVTINAPIVGVGGLDPEYGGSGAALSLFGDNTYSGGTALTSSSTLVYYNNNNSFGTGTITANYGSGSYAPMLSTGGSTITLANNIQNIGTGGGINFANGANTPVVLNGTVSLGTTTFNIRNNGNSTAPLTINGVISGSTGGNVVYSGANGGTIHLGAVGTYTGTTTIGQTSATSVTLELDAANAISSSSQIILAGGTLNLGGFSHTMTGSLSLSGASTASAMDFGSGGAVAFTGGVGTLGTGDTLDLLNWTGADNDSAFYLGTTATDESILGDIEFDGTAGTLGDAAIDANGYVYETPEPSTIALGLLGGLGILVMRRKKA